MTISFSWSPPQLTLHPPFILRVTSKVLRPVISFMTTSIPRILYLSPSPRRQKPVELPSVSLIQLLGLEIHRAELRRKGTGIPLVPYLLPVDSDNMSKVTYTTIKKHSPKVTNL